MTRDYGVVRNAFWESETIKPLDPEHKFVGLYLLTSPHTNAIGCFRLPVAYVAEDTGMTPKGLEGAFAALRAAGFMQWCERHPWIWIPNYLKHNPPENPNVWRKCVKEMKTLPIEISARAHIAEELFKIAAEERMKKLDASEINALEPFRNGIETVSKGCAPYPLPCPLPKPEPEPSQSQVVSSADADPSTQAFQAYNLEASRNGWPEAQRLTPKRRSGVMARLRECGGLEGWREAMGRAGRSDFLTGRVPRSNGHANWLPDLDFFLQQQSFTKLMEGTYDNHKTAERKSSVVAGIELAHSLVTGGNAAGNSRGIVETFDPDGPPGESDAAGHRAQARGHVRRPQRENSG